MPCALEDENEGTMPDLRRSAWSPPSAPSARDRESELASLPGSWVDDAPVSHAEESEKRRGQLRCFGTRVLSSFFRVLIPPHLTPYQPFLILLTLHSSPNCQSQVVPEMPTFLQCQGGGVEGAASWRSVEGGVQDERNIK